MIPGTVLRDIPVDVVEATIANGYVDLAAKEHTEELHESGYNSSASATLQHFHNT